MLRPTLLLVAGLVLVLQTGTTDSAGRVLTPESAGAAKLTADYADYSEDLDYSLLERQCSQDDLCFTDSTWPNMWPDADYEPYDIRPENTQELPSIWISKNRQADGPLAKAFCQSPEFNKLSCGFASNAEVKATINRLGPLCTSQQQYHYRWLPHQLPQEVSGTDGYAAHCIRLVSLACKGPVVVRSVFKILEERAIEESYGFEGTDCTHSRMIHVDDRKTIEGGNASLIVRCELDVTSTSSAEAAMKAKESDRCWLCGPCRHGRGCISEAGKWYSDSYTTVAHGCDIDDGPGYALHRVGVNINPQTKILLAKFEVCNNPACFDAAYEQQKLKATKPCIKGVCAPYSA